MENLGCVARDALVADEKAPWLLGDQAQGGEAGEARAIFQSVGAAMMAAQDQPVKGGPAAGFEVRFGPHRAGEHEEAGGEWQAGRG